ncbi:hypothetical protein [Deinococcus arcticus]|uniref:Uncharacterized protein n=1 Tax=Deinococcus arcticus TaxID=2136176 RepID=A0A2T3W3Y3_9DEIO|nr:hypothetical protein [Deinococcus arcticus]PTA66473.1 hypothetical protein C8263_17715 [Deinococcus arcticus]
MRLSSDVPDGAAELFAPLGAERRRMTPTPELLERAMTDRELLRAQLRACVRGGPVHPGWSPLQDVAYGHVMAQEPEALAAWSVLMAAGMVRHEDSGVPEEARLEAAQRAMRQAAVDGLVSAQARLGTLLIMNLPPEGEKAQVPVKEAVRWLEQALEMGQALLEAGEPDSDWVRECMNGARLTLGSMLALGIGAERDLERARELIESARGSFPIETELNLAVITLQAWPAGPGRPASAAARRTLKALRGDPLIGASAARSLAWARLTGRGGWPHPLGALTATRQARRLEAAWQVQKAREQEEAAQILQAWRARHGNPWAPGPGTAPGA